MEKSAWGQGSLGKVNIITLATPLPPPIIISLAALLPDANLRPLFGPTFLIRDGSTGGWLGNHLVISYNEPGSC